MCCYSDGGITDEWGKLFLPLCHLQKKTKTPFTAANNALMWAPAPCGRTGPALCAPPIATPGSGHPLPVGDPHWLPRQAGERWDGLPPGDHRPGMQPRRPHRPGAGCLLGAEVQPREAEPPSSVGSITAAAGQGRAGTSIIHTQRRRGGGVYSAGASSPTEGPARDVRTPGRPSWMSGGPQPLSPPSATVALGCSLGQTLL